MFLPFRLWVCSCSKSQPNRLYGPFSTARCLEAFWATCSECKHGKKSLIGDWWWKRKLSVRLYHVGRVTNQVVLRSCWVVRKQVLIAHDIESDWIIKLLLEVSVIAVSPTRFLSRSFPTHYTNILTTFTIQAPATFAWDAMWGGNTKGWVCFFLRNHLCWQSDRAVAVFRVSVIVLYVRSSDVRSYCS